MPAHNLAYGVPLERCRAEPPDMNDFDQAFLAFQAAEQVRRSAEAWLAAFETALVARDAAKIGVLFHHD